jgi:uncharacterized LabA/DUF88 family protein
VSVTDRPTNVYIDGFNLYYGALKNTSFKWLDVLALSRAVLTQHNTINRIYYYTARVKPRFRDDQVHIRQGAYLRALATIPCVEVVFGTFLAHAVELPLDKEGPLEMVRVRRTDEKGSDVSLATQLVADAYQGNFEVAMVISNDSDQVAPIRHVAHDLGIPVGVLTPERDHGKRSDELKAVASFYKAIGPATLARCQFPRTLTDARGSFSRPPRWQ